MLSSSFVATLFDYFKIRNLCFILPLGPVLYERKICMSEFDFTLKELLVLAIIPLDPVIRLFGIYP